MTLLFNPNQALQGLAALQTDPTALRSPQHAMAAVALQLFPRERALLCGLETLTLPPDLRTQAEAQLQRRAAQIAGSLSTYFPDMNRDYDAAAVAEALWRMRVQCPFRDLIAAADSDFLPSVDLPIPLGGVLAYEGGKTGVALLDYGFNPIDDLPPFPLTFDLVGSESSLLERVQVDTTPAAMARFCEEARGTARGASRSSDDRGFYLDHPEGKACSRLGYDRWTGRFWSASYAEAPSGHVQQSFTAVAYGEGSRYQWELVAREGGDLPYPLLLRSEMADTGAPGHGRRAARLDATKRHYLFFPGELWEIERLPASCLERFPHEVVAPLVAACRNLWQGEPHWLPTGIVLSSNPYDKLVTATIRKDGGRTETISVRFDDLSEEGWPLSWTASYEGMRVRCLRVTPENAEAVRDSLLRQTGLSRLGPLPLEAPPWVDFAGEGRLEEGATGLDRADLQLITATLAACEERYKRGGYGADYGLLPGAWERAFTTLGWDEFRRYRFFGLLIAEDGDRRGKRDFIGLEGPDRGDRSYYLSWQWMGLPLLLETFHQLGWDGARILRFFHQSSFMGKKVDPVDINSICQTARALSGQGWPPDLQEELLTAFLAKRGTLALGHLLIRLGDYSQLDVDQQWEKIRRDFGLNPKAPPASPGSR